jgi:hypothetical protein
MSKVFEKYHNWNYKNTSLFVVSLVLLYFLADVSWFKSAINYIGLWGYFGAFIVGIFFVSIFTVAPAILVLYSLVAKLNPLGIAAFAGLGAVVGDYVIFRFFRDRVFEELRPLAGKFKIDWEDVSNPIFLLDPAFCRRFYYRFTVPGRGWHRDDGTFQSSQLAVSCHLISSQQCRNPFYRGFGKIYPLIRHDFRAVF